MRTDVTLNDGECQHALRGKCPTCRDPIGSQFWRGRSPMGENTGVHGIRSVRRRIRVRSRISRRIKKWEVA